MGRIEIHGCRHSDVEAVQRFIDQHWRPGHILTRDEALFRWQFDSTRKTGHEGFSILLAREQDRVVGMLGLIGFDFNVRGMVIPGVWLSQWTTLPEVRSLGVGMDLLWAVRDLGYEAIFVLGANEIARKIYAAMGFEILPSVPRWVGVFDIEGAIQLLKRAAPSEQVNRLRQFCAEYAIDRRLQASKTPQVQILDSCETFAGEWDRFCTNELQRSFVGPNKDAAYLNWRYINHPLFKYEMRLALEAKTRKIVGLAVFRIEKVRGSDEKILRIVEFLSSPQAEAPLGESLVGAARDSGVIFADFYCTSEKRASALENVGFQRVVPTDRIACFPARFQPLEAEHSEIAAAFWLSGGLRKELGKLAELQELYDTKADSDQDRPN